MTVLLETAATEPRVLVPGDPPRGLRTAQLLASVCHDLRDPLTSIVMGAGFLGRALAPEDLAAQRVVVAIQRAATRMNQLIMSFSDLARLEMGELDLALASHDVGAVVTTAFERLEAQAAGVLPVRLLLEVAPGVPTLPCDRERLLQLLACLGAAALHVVPEGGSVVVQAATAEGGGALIAVVARRCADAPARRIVTGPPPPDLALARGFIELHGASLVVVGDEDALTMSFSLPAARSDSPSA